MPFRCPECEDPQSLRIARRMELPPDSRSDEIALQIVECARCGFAGIAVYEESRRGALDSESVDHAGYRVGAEDLSRLRERMARCPRPANPRCRCSAHRTLGGRDASGRWDGLGSVELKGAFRMELGGGS